MQYNSKATPKSCACQQCKRANAKALGLAKLQERSFRHRMNQATRKESADILPSGMRQRNG